MIEQLRAEILGVWTEYTGIASAARSASRDLTDADRERRDVLSARIEELEAQLRGAEHEDGLAKRIAAITERQTDVAERQGAKDPEAEYRRVFVAYLRDGAARLTPDEADILCARADHLAPGLARDQGIATGGAGGFTVPAGFWAKVTEVQKSFSGMLQVANVLNTDSGQPIPWPVNDDTGNEGEILGENVASTVLDMVFTQKNLGAFMFTSRLFRVSVQLMQDSGVDIEAYVARKAGQRLGRRLNRALTVGVGTTEPLGVVPGTLAPQILVLPTGNVGVNSTGAQAFWKHLITLEKLVDAAYRESGACRYMLSDTTLGEIQKTEGTDNRPMWIPSTREGVPATINGYPYTVNNHMAVPAASAKTVVFGDFKDGYVARKVNGGSVLRLSERYAEALQVGFLAYERNDGTVDDGKALSVLQHSAT